MTATPTSTEEKQSAAMRHWTLDVAGSTVEFKLRHIWGLITVLGHFDRFCGTYRRGTLRVSGDLEAAGKTVALSFDATVREIGDEIEATTPVDHPLLDMTWSPLGALRAPATLHVKARLR